MYPKPNTLFSSTGRSTNEQENRSVEEKVEAAIAGFDFADTAYCYDTSPGRMAYFFHDPERFWKHIRPVRKQ